MNAIDLCIFLTSYAMVVAFAGIAELLRTRKVTSLLSVVMALLVIAATTYVGFYLKPGTNYLGLLWFLVEARDFSAAAAMGLGAAAALVWLSRLTDNSQLASDNHHKSIRPFITQLVLAASIIGVGFFCQAFIWRDIRGVQLDPAVRVHAPGFVIEKVADLEFRPTRVAVSDTGQVFVCYDYFETAGTIGGSIVELTQDDASGKFRKRIVADSPLLIRCYGLVARGGDLIVSRSGFSPQATQGTVTYESTGAVTQLRDVDGDGFYEYMHDIVTGLPGARGPVTMHQNNGISFAPDGSLFVTTASADNRSLDDHPWGGVVLRVSPDFTKTEIFAEGFRNPFASVIGPDNELFVSDNDIDENPGDELNHVVRGAHYGHPFVVADEFANENTGFQNPILVGELESNFLGMAFATSPALPEPYRNCIYVADFMKNAILQLKLEKSGETYKVTKVDTFATISSPIDVAVTDSGEFFVTSRRTQNVYRIRPRTLAAKGNND